VESVLTQLDVLAALLWLLGYDLGLLLGFLLGLFGSLGRGLLGFLSRFERPRLCFLQLLGRLLLQLA
jgi:hypothetical protein